MDVVKTNIESIGGTIELHSAVSRADHGTEVKIFLPREVTAVRKR